MSDDKHPLSPEAADSSAVPAPEHTALHPTAAAGNQTAGATMADDFYSDDIPQAQIREIIETLQNDLDDARASLEAREAQLEAANEKVLRGYAEIENMRKRVEREKEETAKYAITKLARDIVEVADNFERAIASVPADAKSGNPALTSLLEGVTLTEREFLKTLERHGITRVAPAGEPFNPHQHQAVMEQADPSVATGTVLQVFQVGYLIEDRVLRPAMVVVSTGGPKIAKPAGGNGGLRPGEDRPGEDTDEQQA